MVRTGLEALYRWTAYLGAFFIVGIGLLITAQVIGREIGVQVKGADDITAWSVVAAGFLPLAHTYRKNGQIRVTLLIERSSGLMRTALELLVLGVALFFVGFLCFSAFDMAWDSFRFGDLSQGLIVIPIWIPQISIGIGTLVLVIAIVEDVVSTMLGRLPSYVVAAAEASERHDMEILERSGDGEAGN